MDEFPPIPFVKQVAMHCPQALFTYILLWEQSEGKGLLRIPKNEIKSNLFITRINFERHLLSLVREGLLISIQDRPDVYDLKLVLWSDIEPD